MVTLVIVKLRCTTAERSEGSLKFCGKASSKQCLGIKAKANNSLTKYVYDKR